MLLGLLRGCGGLVLLRGLLLEDAEGDEVVLDLLEGGEDGLAVVGDGRVVVGDGLLGDGRGGGRSRRRSARAVGPRAQTIAGGG